MSVQFPSARSIFEGALELPPEIDRHAFLNDACGENSELRAQVESLLTAHIKAGSFLEHPAIAEAIFPPHLGEELGEGFATIAQPPIAERPGMVIGPYKLLQQIGEGGFGVVFLAEQDRPVRRKVALKIIKPGMDSREVIARFEAERQAVAMMDHPNIAKVYDAGATENGRPYFVMELVQGVPITEYCDQCNLTTRERLELFIAVCQAVQHAHQKGVIHRDIKPTNVLVAIQDGRPSPKIIDFGVAKAINQQLTEHTLMTAFAQIVGTPLYMSPEQAELSPLGVDTRSDIYSLGVLLYELLTGTTPFDKDRLQAASYDELRRIIREEEPPRPSARISTLAADLATTVAERRRTDAHRLRQTICGELDWIVMKCLEKDRNRRYETPTSLARDIERYLHDEPVQACPPSLAYRLRKFVRRNKVGALAGSAVALALVAGVALAMAGFVQARRQAQISAAEASKATAISELLQSALQSANPDQAKGPDYTVRQLLDDFSGGLADQLAGQPEVEADIRATIGNAYRQLGIFYLAAPQFETALALRRRIGGTDDANYAKILVDYAQNLAEQTHIADAERTAREAIRIYRRAGISGRPLVKALWILQLQLAYRVDAANEQTDVRAAYAEEQAIVQEAIAIAQADGAEYPELANMLHRHAPLMSKQGDQAGAEQWARRAVEMHRRVHGNEHLETAHGLADLGRVLRDRKKYREAATAFREALEIFRHYYGDNFTTVQGIRVELDQALIKLGDAADSPVQDSAAQEAPKNAEHDAGNAAANRSVRLAQDALERELRDALKSIEKDIASSTDNKSLRLMQAATYRQLAEIDVKYGKLEEAIQFFGTAAAIASRLVDEDPKNSSYAEERLRARLRLAETLARTKRMDEFLTAYEAVLAASEEALASFPNQLSTWPLTSESYVPFLGYLQMCAQRAPEKAEQAHLLFDRAIELFDKIHSVSNADTALGTANFYILIAPKLATNSDWSRHLLNIEPGLTALLQEISAKFPNNARARENVGHKFRQWAFAMPLSDAYQASAERALRQAITVFEKLTIDFPDNVSTWHYLADTHRHLGRILEQDGRTEEAEKEHRRAVELLDERAGTFDATPINDADRAASYLDLASFLARTERVTEAEEYYRKGLDVLNDYDNPHLLDFAEIYTRIAYDLATSNGEKQAAEFVRKAARYAQDQSHPAVSANALYYVGLLQLRLGDEAGYRASCQALIELPDYNAADVVRARPIWTSCLAPHSLDDLDLLVKRAEEYVANASTPNRHFANRHFDLVVLGGALYRAGQYKRAVDRLTEASGLYPGNPPNYQRLFLAMAWWKLGHRDFARRLLAQTQVAVDKELQSLSSAWDRRATLEVLLAEAEALIESDQANVVPNNDQPTTNDTRSDEQRASGD
jgi:serine/threonine protein kinase